MATTQPIKKTKDIEAIKSYLLKKNARDYALFCIGINTALRIGDLLSLKWGDVYDFEKKKYQKHITLKEQKTGKDSSIALNKHIADALDIYRRRLGRKPEADQYLFAGRREGTHLSRSQAYRIIKQAAESAEVEGNISCHSMRKTFGYHAWKTGVEAATLMLLFNHSSFGITKRYLGIDQDERDGVFLRLLL